MPDENDLTPFADALKRLDPQPANLSRDALLFEAGKAAAAPRVSGWFWQSATATFAGVSFVLAAFLMSPGTPNTITVERPVYVQVPAPEAPSVATVPERLEPVSTPKTLKSDDSTDTAKALQVRRDVFRWGIEMLPESKSAGGGPSQDVMARKVTHWLNLPPGTFALPAAQPKKDMPEEKDE
jgi:hypothetical protein